MQFQYAQGIARQTEEFGCKAVDAYQTGWLPEVLSRLMARQELPPGTMRRVMEELMAGRCGEVEAAAFLVALRFKGETASELAEAAAVLREHMLRWDPGRDGVLDTCGTGGDGSGTFNISTAAALVAAACGVPVVKHGNRAVSGRSGSADVLRALGVQVEGDAALARRCLDVAGLAFCFAPHFHPAMRHVARLRQRLGVPTLFNCLGPLANPAGAPYQLLGVGRLELLDLMAGALARLGTRHALVVCGEDGLDEVSLTGPTQVRQVREGTVACGTWTPEDFGLERCSLSDLQADGPQASAARVRSILEGQDGPATRVVLANTAAALLAAQRVRTPVEGVALARSAIASGRAKAVLERLAACSEQETTSC
jgi:anthranilate phosphoribosyltransferase